MYVEGSRAKKAITSFHGNLNYRSTSALHPILDIDVFSVVALTQDPRKRKQKIDPKSLHFTHGVASGCLSANSVILRARTRQEKWTPALYILPAISISHSRYLLGIISLSKVCTLYVEAKNLISDTTYWYQFDMYVEDIESPLGRARIIPLPVEDLSETSLSCSLQSWQISLN